MLAQTRESDLELFVRLSQRTDIPRRKPHR